MTHGLAAVQNDGHEPLALPERIYVGIDIGYREHVAAAIPISKFKPDYQQGKTGHQQDKWRSAKTIHFSSDMTGFKRLRSYLDRFSTHNRDFLIILEPTGGFYALNVLMYLLNEGYTVFQVENRAVKDYREKTFGSETKTDDTDVRLMARMGFLHEVVGEEFSIQPVHLANPDYAAVRDMVHDYVKLRKEITRRLNQLQRVAALTFPELKTFFKSSTSAPSARRLLDRFPTTKQLAEASTDEITNLLKEAGAYSHAKRAQELQELARASAGLSVMTHHHWRQGWLIKQLDVLEPALADLLERMRQAVSEHPYTPIIESLPVKSPIWTATLIAVIVDIDRFKGYAEFKAYIGWYPRVAQSGSSVNFSGLGRKGVRLSRNVLGQRAAILLAPTVPSTPFREFYNRLVARGVKGATAKGHMAGKLSVVLYQMLKTKTLYDANQHRRAMGFPVPAEEASAASVEAPIELLTTMEEEGDLVEVSAEDSDSPSPP